MELVVYGGLSIAIHNQPGSDSTAPSLHPPVRYVYLSLIHIPGSPHEFFSFA